MRAALALFAAVALGGCANDPSRGYAMRPAHSERVHSVTVSVFENTTFEHGLEAELTDAIVREIRRTTAWSVTPGAQTTLSGRIVEATLSPLSTVRGTGLVQEQLVTIRVDFEWRHNHTGQVLASRNGFATSETFVPARPAAERYEHGRHSAVERLARDIVAELRSNW